MKKGMYMIVIAAMLVFNASAGSGKHVPGSNNLLPVVAGNAVIGIHLHASMVNNVGEVNWAAAKKITVRRYELEKSSDGQSFTYVTAVAGNTNIIRAHSFFAQDRNLFDGMNYYRIKVIDSKGDFYYSAMATLDTKAGKTDIKILPAPVRDKLHVWMPGNTAIESVVIADAAGRTFAHKWVVTNSGNLADIEMTKLPPGFYTAKLVTSKGQVVTQKFMKQ